MKDPVIRGEKLINNISCETNRWVSFQEALTSNAMFWNPVQCSPQVKLVNLVRILKHFSKDFHNDFDSYCKGLTEKVMVSFKVELIDVACFYSEVQELFRWNWLMKNIFFPS